MSKEGIVLAGNIIVDHIKLCDRYPNEEHLALIAHEIKSNGGAPLNVAFDLRILGYSSPIAVLGCTGNDESAEFLIKECNARNIDTHFFRSNDLGTSYTDVFVSETSGKRTFFHNPGANALFHQTELNRAYAGYQHLHYGYLNLLGKMDLVYEGETGTAQLLKSAQLLGLTTSIDLVSSQSSHYAETVIASLPYTNLLFCNEIELGQLLNLKEIKRDATSAKSYYQRLFNLGFSGALILHTKTWAFYIDRESYYLQPALQVPQGSIKSNSGAGDAFAAGFLFDYLKDFKPELALLKATYAAATCLTAITCSDGVQPFSQAVQTLSTFIFHND